MMGETDIEACRTMLRGGSRTFFAASKVLPTAVAEPAIALYAFCREADDAVDSGGGRKGGAGLYEGAARPFQRPPFLKYGGSALSPACEDIFIFLAPAPEAGGRPARGRPG